MTSFSEFDTRGYRTVAPREGYDRWAATYEETVEDAMDIALLGRLAVDWEAVGSAADLGCGTGRTGAWLAARGVGKIDGVDLSPGMLEAARARGVYRSLGEAEVADTGLPGGAYDLVASCLVDEHLADLRPLYAEAARLPAIETHVHLLSDHVAAGLGADLTLAALHERVIDDEWIALKPKWERFRDHPVSFAFTWSRPKSGPDPL
jgi:SAM-dependent methyltransferase